MNVALYVRVSSERQAEKETPIEGQLTELRSYAQGKGWTIVKEYIEAGESARSDRRPVFQEMISDAKTHRYDFQAILVWKFSRFARNSDDSTAYKALLRKKCRIDIISVKEPIEDSVIGRLLERIIEAIDQFYSENLAQDCLRGMRENARRGFFNGGNIPIGYKPKKVSYGEAFKTILEVDDTYAPTVKRIFQMCLDGIGSKEIAVTLNSEGVLVKAKKGWTAQKVLFILRNEVYVGRYVWNKEKRSEDHQPMRENADHEIIKTEDNHPAIIEKEEFARAQELLNSRNPLLLHPRVQASDYLLSGLLRCGKCGKQMSGARAKSGQYQYYSCVTFNKQGKAACDAKQIPRQKLDDAVLDLIQQNVLTDSNLVGMIEAIDRDEHQARAQYEEEVAGIEQQIKKVQAALANLFEALESKLLSLSILAPRIESTQNQLTNLERAKHELQVMVSGSSLEELTPALVKQCAKDFKKMLDDGSLVEKKNLLRSFIKGITYNYPELTVEYLLPVAPDGVQPFTREVLSMDKNGRAFVTDSKLICEI